MSETRVFETSTVVAPTGTYHGLVDDRGVAAFLGIPFATVPGRWQKPVGLPDSTDTIEATAYGPACWQDFRLALDAWNGEEPTMSEDCLYLNVWAASNGGENRPVLVWIHGGSFMHGAANDAFQGGANLGDRLVADNQDVIYVSIQYRLGLFGCVDLSSFEGGEDYADTTDLQTLDQIAALEWVNRNIAAFGGDPDNVTVMGQSAGGYSVFNLMVSAPANRLFCKAGAASSGFTDVTANSPEKLTASSEKLKELTKATTVDELLAIPAADLAKLTSALFMEGFSFEPKAGGSLIPRYPTRALAEGAAKHVSLLAGSVEGEMDQVVLGMDAEQIAGTCQACFPKKELVADALEAVRANDQGRGDTEAYRDLFNDVNIRMRVLLNAEAQASAGAPVHLFYITYRATDSQVRTQHGFEIPYLTGRLDARDYLDRRRGEPVQSREPSERLQHQIQAAWLDFVRTGDPNGEGVPAQWPRFSAADPKTMVIDREWTVVDGVRPLDASVARPFHLL